MSSGERPIGAAKGKQSDTGALCQPPSPPDPTCRCVVTALHTSVPTPLKSLRLTVCDRKVPLVFWATGEPFSFCAFVLTAPCAHVQEAQRSFRGGGGVWTYPPTHPP